jgi:hypothetical protein
MIYTEDPLLILHNSRKVRYMIAFMESLHGKPLWKSLMKNICGKSLRKALMGSLYGKPLWYTEELLLILHNRRNVMYMSAFLLWNDIYGGIVIDPSQ